MVDFYAVLERAWLNFNAEIVCFDWTTVCSMFMPHFAPTLHYPSRTVIRDRIPQPHGVWLSHFTSHSSRFTSERHTTGQVEETGNLGEDGIRRKKRSRREDTPSIVRKRSDMSGGGGGQGMGRYPKQYPGVWQARGSIGSRGRRGRMGNVTSQMQLR